MGLYTSWFYSLPHLMHHFQKKENVKYKMSDHVGTSNELQTLKNKMLPCHIVNEGSSDKDRMFQFCTQAIGQNLFD